MKGRTMEIHKKNISAAAVLSGQITVPKVSEEWRKEIQGEWDRIAKPLGSFGKLEKIHTAIGAIQQRRVPDLDRMELLVCCGDHGIVEEGVSQSGQEVTAICAENIGKGQSCAGILAAAAHAKIRAIDVGLHHPGPVPGTEFRRVADGTRNFLKEPAMSRAQFRTALQLGLDLAAECRKAGVRVLGVGEMGIGNTTSAAVLAGRMLGLSAETVTGRGAGLDGAGLQRKRKVIAAALKMPDVSSDVEAIWCRFGGLELTAMMGIILGGGLHGIPVVLDGLLSLVSAEAAERLVPGIREYMIPSHISREPAACRLAESLGLEPVLDAGMGAGEGVGAVMMMSLLRDVNRVYREAKRFDGYGMEPYTRYEE